MAKEKNTVAEDKIKTTGEMTETETLDDAGKGSFENSEVETDEDGPKDESDEAKDLVALRPILYLSRQYKVGDKLPANNPDMVRAWIDAHSAEWMSARKEIQGAKPVTAEPGLSGMAYVSETDNNLVGKVPRTASRKK